MTEVLLGNGQKKFEDLNVIDNFLFNELEMQADTDSAKEFVRILLETILQKKVTKIRLFPQLVEQGRMPGQHGIQIDSYVEACVGEGEEEETMIFPIKPEVFDIEPNTYETDSEERRMRYYRALIDSKILAAGVKYKDMKNVTLIMISNYDPFDRDRMIYTFSTKCEEELDLEYDDGVKTLYLYAYGKKGTGNSELADLLRYMVDSRQVNVTNANIKAIQKMVEEIKRNSKIGVKYMQSWEIRQITYDQGVQDGRNEGIKEGIKEGISRALVENVENVMKNFHLDLKTVCEGIGTTVEEYEKAKKMVELSQSKDS